ncbi:hypothetical protein [Polaromonas sp.]|uniref:hypothetical protein n=1 Tax=Polaromonas sp. TaxID=1869339 RepID=UPI0013B5C839|nr:hypothetical protein [Polaromonas sp.]NDP62211.1 hypothetical protein [Polaromonas sp.]
MRIISFSHAPVQAFWTVPVQALAPWITRIRHSLGHSAIPFITQPSATTSPSTFQPCTATASNDAIFEVLPQNASLPRITMPQETTRSVLRVVRVSDAAMRPDCAGRMVISGRMADVCAELDRMALQAESTIAK